MMLKKLEFYQIMIRNIYNQELLTSIIFTLLMYENISAGFVFGRIDFIYEEIYNDINNVVIMVVKENRYDRRKYITGISNK